MSATWESKIFDAAVELIVFTKTNEYPEENSENFIKQLQLLDKLETALRGAGYLPKGRIVL